MLLRVKSRRHSGSHDPCAGVEAVGEWAGLLSGRKSPVLHEAAYTATRWAKGTRIGAAPRSHMAVQLRLVMLHLLWSLEGVILPGVLKRAGMEKPGWLLDV